jgi:peptidoglycan/xylan/chitin deacetylase (PgdA/CDA1 family)
VSLRTVAAPLKPVVRLGFFGAKRLGLPWLDFGNERLAVILRYHSIGDASTGVHRYATPGITLSQRLFERQIAFLVRNYRVVRMDDLVEALDGGRRLPRNAVIITFDDGYLDNFELAYPVLRKHGTSAMFYLVSGCLDDGRPIWTAELRHLIYSSAGGRLAIPTLALELDLSSGAGKEAAISSLTRRLAAMPRESRDEVLREIRGGFRTRPASLPRTMLTWREVKDMQRGGMNFGAHTVTHPLLPSIPLSEAREEIAGSKATLESELHTPIHHFSYPNPGAGVHIDAAVERLVADAGFATAVTSRGNYVTAGDDPLGLRRLATGAKAWGLPWDLEREALGKRFRNRSP